jgi:hypothetical protein
MRVVCHPEYFLLTHLSQLLAELLAKTADQ